jgi:hypothetical protein
MRPPPPPTTPSKNVGGFTDPEFDGVGTPDLRAWLRYWCDKRKSAEEARVRRPSPRDEVARLRAEINARYQAGQARKPADPC